MTEEIKAIPENVRAMADNLKKDANVEENVISFDDNAFKNNLPEDIKYNQVKAIEKHKANFSAAVHLATGEIGNDLINENDFDTVTTTPVDMVYSQLKVTQHKHKSGISKIRDTETAWNNYGVLTSILTTRIDRKVGSVKIVRDHIMRQARELFGE